ncbi:MAG TPA: TrkA family potassium uptake protein [Candidatus Acetatifactor stercoripullorum]|uniref:TrkA family potassium uptake protein n=1 Tax=Candidatus Acetatifactor stercoripullorum TaxID=2838414 RepID=A0A9D1UB46_9FIRM|nr:TrkA family potassium uptake protein [Candidatus Acetatifactor stercoripullorum]HIW81327.1 TrkA family potassium uptake protein [Candidatus Acetatifactor stercoripullorum]
MFKKKEIAYGIIGLGRFGYALATELTASGAEILVLDKNEEKIREMRELTENAFVVRNLDKNTLMETGIQNCDVAIVCIGEQIATSILTTLNLVGLGIPKVVSKATSMEHGEILKKLGAEVVYPEQDMAVRLAHRLETSKVLDYIQLSERLNISKMAVPAGIIGKTVLEVDLRGRFGLNIIAVENAGGLVDSVKPEYTFREGDILFVAGGTEGFSELAAWVEND